jgi:hypothetical protein
MSILGRLLRREDLHSLAAPYALDALEPAERVRFERHLKGCDRCAAEVRDLSEDAVRLAWSTTALAPPGLRDRVLTAVRNTPQDPAPAQGASPSSSPRSSPCRPRGRRTDSTPSAPRHVRSPTFWPPRTPVRPATGMPGAEESE